jgi:hypothetical protein
VPAFSYTTAPSPKSMIIRLTLPPIALDPAAHTMMVIGREPQAETESAATRCPVGAVTVYRGADAAVICNLPGLPTL